VAYQEVSSRQQDRQEEDRLSFVTASSLNRITTHANEMVEGRICTANEAQQQEQQLKQTDTSVVPTGTRVAAVHDNQLKPGKLKMETAVVLNAGQPWVEREHLPNKCSPTWRQLPYERICQARCQPTVTWVSSEAECRQNILAFR
jgi:hypothetical protein